MVGLWYPYREIVSAEANVNVFNSFEIKGSVVYAPETTGDLASGKQYLQNYADAKITVTAYAIQADGFATAKAAWDAAGLN